MAAELQALKEIIKPWHTGLLYKPDDPIDLAEKICILLDDKKWGEEMGKAGRKLVENKYDWDKLASQFVSITEDFYRLKK